MSKLPPGHFAELSSVMPVHLFDTSLPSCGAEFIRLLIIVITCD